MRSFGRARRARVGARAALAGALWVAGAAALPAAGQENPTAEQLKKMYDDTLVQLKAAQDRKSELAGENEKLQARVAELEKQLGEAKVELAGHASKTFGLRAHYAAWHQFIQRYPDLMAKWAVFIERDPLSVPAAPAAPAPTWAPEAAPDTPSSAVLELIDPDWPLSADG